MQNLLKILQARLDNVPGIWAVFPDKVTQGYETVATIDTCGWAVTFAPTGHYWGWVLYREVQQAIADLDSPGKLSIYWVTKNRLL